MSGYGMEGEHLWFTVIDGIYHHPPPQTWMGSPFSLHALVKELW